MLLTVSGRAAWLLAGGLLAAEVAVRSGVTGLPLAPAWFAVFYVVAYYVDDGLAFFGMVRLAQIVDEVEDARSRAAALAVADERLLAARSLHSAVGQRLADISAMAAAARHALSRDAAQARARIAEAGITAREAVARAREVAAGDRSLPRREPAASPFAGAVIGARLAWVVAARGAGHVRGGEHRILRLRPLQRAAAGPSGRATSCWPRRCSCITPARRARAASPGRGR